MMFGRHSGNFLEARMEDWTTRDLEEWDEKIRELASGYDLDWFPIIYEICDYYDMIGHMSYHGMPSHYPHWSFGKSFERTHQMYNAGMQGLPYELIINSNPSIAYLMRENPLYLQILIMAHCVGHSDFFKNNATFKDTSPETVNIRFKGAKRRIMEYIEDPSIGIEKVERIIDAVHAIQFQTYRWPINRKKHGELKKEYESLVKNDKTGEYKDFNLNKFPLEPDYDLLGFISEYSKNLSSWEKDIVNIVREESHYFIPQIKTKVINEGWASFWHYKLMNELKLPQKYHIPFLKSHNQVIRPHIGAINPYHLGFHIFKKIEEKHGLERCFFAREICHDQSFIREYLELEDGIDLNLFTYSKKKNYYSIDDISNEDDWKEVKNTLINNVGMSTMPRIFVEEVENSDTLILSHEHEGRDLEIQYANKVVEHIKTLWGDNVKLFTIVEDEAWIID